MNPVYILRDDAIREGAAAQCYSAPLGTVVTFKDKKRSLDQNDKIHPMVRDVAKQVLWMRSGVLQPMSEGQWRHFFAAHVIREAEMVPNMEGSGFVVLGVGTSEMTSAQASEAIELIYSFGSARGVVWSEKAKEHYEKYRPKERA